LDPETPEVRAEEIDAKEEENTGNRVFPCLSLSLSSRLPTLADAGGLDIAAATLVRYVADDTESVTELMLCVRLMMPPVGVLPIEPLAALAAAAAAAAEEAAAGASADTAAVTSGCRALASTCGGSAIRKSSA
jgi:hypothetical protein